MIAVKINEQKGVALITVMLIVALIAILATQMTSRLQLQMQRTANIASNQQAYWYAMGAEAFAKRLLVESFKKDKNVTHLNQIWAQGENTFPVDFGEITGEITDLQSCFNLNALRVDNGSASNRQTSAKSLARKAFEELVIAISIEGVDNFQVDSMADALMDWLDANENITGSGGAEDSDYASKEYPYLAANNYLASIEELRVIEYFTVPVINKLKEYTCVLPNTNMNKVNVNTIAQDQPEILQAMLGISKNQATQALSGRDEKGFKNIADFFSSNALKDVELTPEQKEQFTVKSEYFNLRTIASFNDSYFAMNTIMKVDNKNKINVISRIIGRE